MASPFPGSVGAVSGLSFNVVYEDAGDGWIYAHVPVLPEAHTQGRDLDCDWHAPRPPMRCFLADARRLAARAASLMSALVQIAALTGALWVGSGLTMVMLAKRLAPGLLRDVAEFLPACVTTARRLRGNPAVPWRAKIALLVAIVWVLSPIDLLPEFLPVIGPLDDVVAVVLLLRYAARAIPRDVLLAAWPAETRLLGSLLGFVSPAAR